MTNLTIKSLVLTVFILLVRSSFANTLPFISSLTPCPNLTGQYVCADKEERVSTLEVTQNGSVYSLDSKSDYADITLIVSPNGEWQSQGSDEDGELKAKAVCPSPNTLSVSLNVMGLILNYTKLDSGELLIENRSGSRVIGIETCLEI